MSNTVIVAIGQQRCKSCTRSHIMRGIIDNRHNLWYRTYHEKAMLITRT
jgi:hypothetical protein